MDNITEGLSPPKPLRVVVGFSGGVTSAWCAGWALRTYPKESIILLFHDTKEEHPDTYRFLHEMAAALGLPITERSHGLSVTELFREEGYLGNQQNTPCSRILKQDQGRMFIEELLEAGFEVHKIMGLSGQEPSRMQKQRVMAEVSGYTVRFPLWETNTTKQMCADWCAKVMKVCPSAMYAEFEHANCIGCVKGGMEYWMRVREVYPEVFEQRAALEQEFGHTIIRGGGPHRWRGTLRELSPQVKISRRRPERIDLPPCECGD